MEINWDQENILTGRQNSTKKFTWIHFHAYLMGKYGAVTAARLRPPPFGLKNKERPKTFFKQSEHFLKAHDNGYYGRNSRESPLP